MLKLSYFYRLLAVALKPLSIFVLGFFFSELYASQLAKFYLYTSISTSIFSGSIYRNYIKGFYAGLSKKRQILRKNLNIHLLLFNIILMLIMISTNAKILMLAIIADFIFHQYYRVSLYTKNFGKWFVLNILSIFIIILLAGLSLHQISGFVINIFNIMSIVVLVILCYITSKQISGRRTIKFLKKFLSLRTLYGAQRKVYISIDKLFLSFILSDEEFWLFALLYQIFSISITAYETIKIFPIKKEFSLESIKYSDANSLKLNLTLVLFSVILACFISSYYQPIDIYMLTCIGILFFRTLVYNLLVIRMEILFWSQNFEKMILWLTMMNVIGLIMGYIIHFENLDANGVMIMILSVISFGVLNTSLRRYSS
jgi:hypothetical protein